MHILILKRNLFGIHKVIRKTEHLFTIYNRKIDRLESVIRTKWYVWRLW